MLLTMWESVHAEIWSWPRPGRGAFLLAPSRIALGSGLFSLRGEATKGLVCSTMRLAAAARNPAVPGCRSGVRTPVESTGLLKPEMNLRHLLPRSEFALPGQRYPISDVSHGRNALARVSQHGTPEEKARVRAAVHRKFPRISLGSTPSQRAPIRSGRDKGPRGHVPKSRRFIRDSGTAEPRDGHRPDSYNTGRSAPSRRGLGTLSKSDRMHFPRPGGPR